MTTEQTTIKAIYQNGVFVPQSPVELEENDVRVNLIVEKDRVDDNAVLSQNALSSNWLSSEDEEAFAFLQDKEQLDKLMQK